MPLSWKASHFTISHICLIAVIVISLDAVLIIAPNLAFAESSPVLTVQYNHELTASDIMKTVASNVESLDQTIQHIPDSAFVNSTSSEQIKVFLHNKLLPEIKEFTSAGKGGRGYYSGNLTVYEEIRLLTDGSVGGNKTDDLIVEPHAQRSVLKGLDGFIDGFVENSNHKFPTTIQIITPDDEATYLLNEKVLADWDAWWVQRYSPDVVNGTVPNGSPIDTSSIGTKYFIVKADPLGWGYTAIKKVSYNVISLVSTPKIAPNLAKTILSPRQQIIHGVSSENVLCHEGYVLVKKNSGNPVACVKPQTAQKLVARGWEMIARSPTPIPTSCPTGQTMANGQCVTSIPKTAPTQACNGDTSIPYSYALPCMRPTPTCPNHMTYSNGMCTTTPPFIPPPPVISNCVPSSNTMCPTSFKVLYPNCNGAFSGNICEPNSIPCPTGLQGDIYGTTCNYSPPKCSTGYSAIKISAGSYSCQPTNQPPLTNPTTYSAGQKVGVFTISTINQYNVTGYYNSPWPIARPGLGDFTIMHVGDTLNPTCDGSAPLVITAINYPNSITVSIGKSMGKPYGGCPICLSENSVIKTPNGDVNVKDIKDGMTVWSTNSNGIIIKSKVIKINNVFVGDTHKVIDLQLADGRELFVSPNHPTYDGRTIAGLKVGETYDGSTVKSIELVQYKYQFTHDILPDSQTGTYWANGILVGSTLK